MIKSINEQLDVKIEIIKQPKLTFFSTFPNLGLKLSNLSVSENPGLTKKPLFTAKSMFIQFDILKILKKEYTVKNIIIDGGNINLFVNKKGITNYNIVKPNKEKNSEKNASNVTLKRIIINNTEVSYSNLKSDVTIKLFCNSLIAKGDFGDKLMMVDTRLKGLMHRLNTNGYTILPNKNIELKSVLTFNNNTGKLDLKNTQLGVSEAMFNIEGFVETEKKQNYEFNVMAKNLTAAKTISIFPDKALRVLNKYKVKGNYSFNGIIKGKSSQNNQLKINANYTCTNASFTEKSSEVSLNKLNFQGKFVYNNSVSDASVVLNSIKANFKDNPIVGALEIRDLENPVIKLDLKGASKLEDIFLFINKDGLSGKGKIDFKIQLHAPIDDLYNTNNIDRLDGTGRIKLEDASMKVNDFEMKKSNGELNFNGHSLKANMFKLIINDVPLLFNGKLNRIFPFLLNKNETLNINGNLNSDNMNLDKLLKMSTPANVKSSEGRMYKFPDNINANIKFNCQKFKRDNFNAKNVKGNFLFKNRKLIFKNLNLKTLDGNLAFDLKIENINNKFMIFSALKGNTLNIQKLLFSFDNFGQKAMTNKHLRGMLNSEAQIALVMDKYLQVIEDDIICNAKVELKHGRLLNFKPLESLSSFIKIEELKDIEFSNLKNEIDISDQVINIPKMEIKNSALNLQIEGKHYFDDRIDYKIVLNVSQLLSKKYSLFKRINRGSYEELGNEGVNIYIKITGTVDKPIITYDRKTVARKVVQTIKEEKKSTLDIIKKELKGDIVDEKSTKTDWDE